MKSAKLVASRFQIHLATDYTELCYTNTGLNIDCYGIKLKTKLKENTRKPNLFLGLLLREKQEGCTAATLDGAWLWPLLVMMVYSVPPSVLGMEQ